MVKTLIEDAGQSPAAERRTWAWLDEKAQITWVFGMRWLPALGAKGQSAMQRNLREQGFSWAVNHGKAVRLIGVHGSTQATDVSRRTASAAVAFALSHPQGTHALSLEVSGLGVWFVACSEGSVLSDTDCWFDTPEQAEVCLRTLRERHEHVQYETSRWQDEGQGQGQAVAVGAAEGERTEAVATSPHFLQASFLNQCRFNRLPVSYAIWQWLAVGGVMLAGLAVAAYFLWSSDSTPPTADRSHAPVAPSQPFARIHRPLALQTLFQAWHVLPVDPEGWLLQSVNCRITEQQALCKASYKRRHADAHNEGLKRHEPQGWVFEPDSLDRAFLKRAVVVPMQPLQPHLRVSFAAGLTQLQRLSARVVALSIGSPNVSHVGQANFAQALDQPEAEASLVSHVPSVTSRTVSLRLALRQASRINELSLPLRWQQADLVVVHGAQIDKSHGYLMLNLQGEWLETH